MITIGGRDYDFVAECSRCRDSKVFAHAAERDRWKRDHPHPNDIKYHMQGRV